MNYSERYGNMLRPKDTRFIETPEEEIARLKAEIVALKERIAKDASDRSWHDEYIRETYIMPNWKADGQW